MKVALVGVTGMVGRKMLEVLKERAFPVSELIPVASSRSLGKEVKFNGRAHVVIGLEEALRKSPDIALFSAGSNISRHWAPLFSDTSCTVIDNSSAWRMEADIPLIIPEINPDKLSSSDRIIANPNCSTIQMLMALAPLHRAFRIKRIIVSTYQSVSGSGKKAMNQLEQEKDGVCTDMAYPYPIYNNCIPQCADFEENSYTTEEMKLVNESHKILGDDTIGISATAVRIPVTGGHSESINVEFHKDYTMEEVRSLLDSFPGVCLQDDPATSLYPMPINAFESDEVFVGRLRRDLSNNKALNLWVVSDNIRKGAATNAVQIAELIINRQVTDKP